MKQLTAILRRFGGEPARRARDDGSPVAGAASPDGALAYELTPASGRAQLTTIPYESAADSRIEVFWKDFTGSHMAGLDARLAGGVGPVISLIVAGFEVMRFDCLGESGHFHVVLGRYDDACERRVWFRERSQIEQVERSVFEMERNLGYFLARNPRREVRATSFEPEEHRRNCARAREAALALWAGRMG